MFYLIMGGIALLGLFAAMYQMRTHPKGLYVLFFVEMWERFSYYGMRALLVLYLTKHFLFDRTDAYGLYGAYITLVYITPVIGGFIADKYLGARKAVLFGGILLVLGHLGMAVEGEPVVAGGTADPNILNIFYLSLAFIIAGVGFLKANISTIVGMLYEKTDIRRDSGFTLYYVGINLGSTFGVLVAGGLGETYGWKYGFGAAGVGMLIGLIMFVIFTPVLGGKGEPKDLGYLKEKVFLGLNREWLTYLGTGGAILILWQLVRSQSTVNYLLMGFGALVVGYIILTSVMQLSPHERNRIFVALFLISVNVLFWGLFEQTGSSLTLYTDEHVNRNFLGQEVKTSLFQSINAIYIVLLGAPMAGMWAWLNKKGLEPSTPMKFALAVFQLGLGFLILVWGAGNGQNLTPVIFIFLIYLLHTTGELCMSPVGLSAMTRLSPTKMVGLMMGTWFLASAAGNSVSALIAQATAVTGPNGESMVLSVYSKVGWYAIGISVVMALAAPWIKKGMHLDTLTNDVEEGVAAE